MIAYDPPTDPADRRICRACRRAWKGHSEVGRWYPIQNGRTGIYHSGGDYGTTDCGRDATAPHWRWPE